MVIASPVLSGLVTTVRAVPSNLHEVLVELFRHRPALAVELLGGVLGEVLPAHRGVRLEPNECVEVRPVQFWADAVVVLTGPDRQPVAAVVVEIQLDRDGDKRFSWAVYLATLRARLRCPVALLVVCTDEIIAAWCATPIELGPGSRVTPHVVGPGRVPVVADPAQAARRPELAVLSALAHGGDPDAWAVLDAVAGAFAAVDDEHATLYSDLVLTALPAAARTYLEALMRSGTYEYQSEFVRRYVFQGRAEGKAEAKVHAVLEVLTTRGVDVPADARARITACTDPDQLDTWIRRAVTAVAVDDLFT